MVKINADGSYAWSKAFGGTERDVASGVSTDANGNSYIAGGGSDNVDFDPGVNVDTKTSFGGRDVFLVKINTYGNYAWAKTFGDAGDDYALGLLNRSNNDIYVVGGFSYQADFDPGPDVDINTSNGSNDCFLLKLNEW